MIGTYTFSTCEYTLYMFSGSLWQSRRFGTKSKALVRPDLFMQRSVNFHFKVSELITTSWETSWKTLVKTSRVSDRKRRTNPTRRFIS